MGLLQFDPRHQVAMIRTLLCFLIALLFVGSNLQRACAGSVTIGRTPILTVTLPTNSTYQVEFSTNETTWTSIGVLVGGQGTTASVRLDGFSANGGYRLSDVGSTNVITPTISSGLYVGASFSGTREVRLESVNQLGAGRRLE